MKKLLSAMLLAGLTASGMANVVLERFDDPKMTTGTISPGGGAGDLRGDLRDTVLQRKGGRK